MGATFVSVLISVLAVCCSQWGALLLFPKFPIVCFFGLYLLVTLLPWRWIQGVSGDDGAYVIGQCAQRSRITDKRVRIYLVASYFVAFCAIAVANFSSIPQLYRWVYSFVSAGLLIDLAKKMYRRLQYRSLAEGLALWIEESVQSAELVSAFESTFSIVSGYVKMCDVASLKLFCLKIIENADSWIRASAQLPGNLSESSMLDRYSIVEAMVAKRMASIIREALQSESIVVLETVVWFEGRLSLAFHGKHASLGHLLLLSLSLALQQSEGKIDRTSSEIEYITMLSEVIKAYIDRTVATRASDRTSILRALALLESHLKESFRIDRRINPAFLMQPFAEVGQQIADEKYASMPDRDDIIAELRRLLSQFAALEGVRAQMDIGTVGTDTKASYQEDKPFLPKR